MTSSAGTIRLPPPLRGRVGVGVARAGGSPAARSRMPAMSDNPAQLTPTLLSPSRGEGVDCPFVREGSGITPLHSLDRRTQPRQDAAPGDVDGADRLPQRLRDLLRRPALDGGPPEGLPGGVAEFGAVVVGGPSEDAATVLLVDEDRLGAPSGAGWASRRSSMSESPLPRGWRSRAIRKLTIRFRAIRKSQPRKEPFAGSGSQRSIAEATARKTSCVRSAASASWNPLSRARRCTSGP